MRELKIAFGNSRRAKFWSNRTMTFDEICSKLKTPLRTMETVEEYANLPKSKRDEIKDKGGFVGGHLRDSLRKAENVACRSLWTPDIDNATPEFAANLHNELHFRCAAYSTHSHTPQAPRLRFIAPLKRDVTADEYVALSRILASKIGIDMFDECSFRPNQLMYWPSCPSNAEYLYEVFDGKELDPDAILASFPNWQDCSLLPATSQENKASKPSQKKQEDPLAKSGIVGAFCRTYSIAEAIDNFLCDIYEPSAVDDRYDYIKGESANGVAIYDDKFAYSHHATDPACGKLLNAFDLVRIHKFGDDDAKKTFKAMSELAMKDDKVKLLLNEERLAEANGDFSLLDDNKDKPARKELFSLKDFVCESPRIEWLIKDFVYKGGSYLEYLFGESGCGKSFAALDMALTIAYGLPLWHFGKKAQQGKVLYFLGEGRPGFVKRIQAWMKAREISEFSGSFYLYVNSAVKLNADGALAHIRSVTKELVDSGWTPDLIIIDTQARFTVGDENRQMDADSYINAFNTLGSMFNATVMVVHHTSKANGETLKGSVNLKGASDINIKVEKSGKAGIRISHEKNKDGQELADLYLGLETIELGYDDDLEPITSLVLKDSSAPVKVEDFKPTRQSRQAQKDLALIQDFIKKYGKKQGCKTLFTRLGCIEYLETYSGFSHAKAVQESHAPNSGLFARLCNARVIIDSHEIGPAPTKGKKGNPQDYEWTFNGGLEDDDSDFLA
ncbi:MAG: AAA family ATPase [Sphaerochaetaceae bacterium]|nr:AAA family ATPase [Sphaerochaeta sp.]